MADYSQPSKKFLQSNKHKFSKAKNDGSLSSNKFTSKRNSCKANKLNTNLSGQFCNADINVNNGKHVHNVPKSKKNDAPTAMPLMRKAAPPLWKKKLAENKNQAGRIVRDPRFDDLSGSLNTDIFRKNYRFLEVMKAKERQELKSKAKNAKNAGDRNRIKQALQIIDSQAREREKIETVRKVKKKQREDAIEALKQGKKPYTKKKSDIRLELYAKHFQQLKQENRLDKYLERKEKKIKAKELFGK